MKGKILNAYNVGRRTYITKQTKYGTFHSKVTCADEDMDVKNDLDGYAFAEQKCDIQSFKLRAKYLEQRAIGVRHAYNVLFKSGIDENDITLKKLKRQIKIAEREAAIAKEQYLAAKEYFNNFVVTTIETRRKIKKRKLDLIGEK